MAAAHTYRSADHFLPGASPSPSYNHPYSSTLPFPFTLQGLSSSPSHTLPAANFYTFPFRFVRASTVFLGSSLQGSILRAPLSLLLTTPLVTHACTQIFPGLVFHPSHYRLQAYPCPPFSLPLAGIIYPATKCVLRRFASPFSPALQGFTLNP